MREIEMVPCSTTGCANMAPAQKGSFPGVCSNCAEERRLRMGWAPMPAPLPWKEVEA